MNSLFITPIQIGSLNSEKIVGRQTEGAFKETFQQAVEQVKETEKQLEQEQYRMVTGRTDDPSSVTVAAAQAQMSVELLVTLKTKALEAYNSLINMNI